MVFPGLVVTVGALVPGDVLKFEHLHGLTLKMDNGEDLY